MCLYSSKHPRPKGLVTAFINFDQERFMTYLLQEHHDQVHWVNGEPLAENVIRVCFEKKLRSKDFMAEKKPSTATSEEGQGSKRVAMSSTGSNTNCSDTNASLALSIKAEGKRSAEV